MRKEKHQVSTDKTRSMARSGDWMTNSSHLWGDRQGQSVASSNSSRYLNTQDNKGFQYLFVWKSNNTVCQQLKTKKLSSL